jgi:hypothetical protein
LKDVNTDMQKELKKGLKTGLDKGCRGFFWMLKILVPVSFGTMLLEYSGLLTHLDFILEPVMGWLNLPVIASLPLVIGMLTGLYAGIAAMSVLALTSDQMTVVAVFMLISHFFIQEGVVQAKSGLNPVMAVLGRLFVSIVTAAVVSWFIGCDASATATETVVTLTSGTNAFLPLLTAWWWAMLSVTLKMLIIIMVLMVFLEVMKELNLIPHLIKPLAPVLKMLGLSPRMGVLWMTAALFGITSGAAVIVEEAKEGNYTPEELTRLQLSIGINHAMIEDPLLFISLGLNPFWLWVPRLLAAVAVVHLHRFFGLVSRMMVPVKIDGNPPRSHGQGKA